MRTQLHIGEIARLLAITPKTIRHYQKLGLLGESGRSVSGYRLFGAKDLLRLQQVRRLQAYGLSLKQIKEILGTAQYEHSLREVLQSLDTTLAQQIQELESRRTNIRNLLAEENLEFPAHSPTLDLIKETFGERLRDISPQVWKQEARVNALLDGFDWSTQHQEVVQNMLTFFLQQPELYQSLREINEGLAILAQEPENSPLVEVLLEQCAQKEESFRAVFLHLQTYARDIMPLEHPLESVFTELIAGFFSPAQQRFFSGLKHLYFDQEYALPSHEVQDHA